MSSTSAQGPKAPSRAPALRTREEWLRMLLEGVREFAFYILDPAGHVITWNRGAERIKGYEANEIIGQSFARFFPQHDVRRGKPARILREAREKGVFEEEGWRVRKDGRQFWAAVVLTAIRDDQGELVGFAKLTRDVTERRRVQNELTQERELFLMFTQAVQDYAMFMLKPDGTVSTWNPGASRIKGYTASEIIGHHFSVFYSDEDIEAGKPDRELVIAAERGRFEEEGLRIRKDGSRFWAHVVLSRVTDAAGQIVGFAKVTRDVTARKQAEEQIRELNRTLEQRVADRTAELERANHQLAVLLQEVHHRVKNNLQVVASMLRLAKSQIVVPGVAEMLNQLIGRVHAMSMVHEALHSGERLGLVDFGTYLRRLIDHIRHADPRAADIDINVAVEDGAFEIDESMPLALIVNEVVSNSLKHAFKGGRGRIDVALKRAGRHVELLIADNGSGQTSDKGTGSGMRIVQALAGQLNGKAEMRLEASGARFRLEFETRSS
jgi:PAS domain S-box-containing protein